MYNQFVRHPAGRKRIGDSRPMRLLTNYQVRFDSMDSSIIAESSASRRAYRSSRVSNLRTAVPTVRGVGINDFPTSVKVNGKNIPPYIAWQNMLGRCYAAEHRPTNNVAYIGCVVVDEWHYFSNFERWYSENYFDGAHLDKDLLFPGNRVYGPDTCIFVTLALNMLLSSNAAVRGTHPLGVAVDGKRFRAMVSENGVPRYLGLFSTPLEAHQAWQAAKADIIERFPTADPRIRKALDLRVVQLRDDLANNRITVSL